MTPRSDAANRSRALGILRERGEFSFVAREILLPAQAFIRMAGSGAGVLLAAAVIALAWANSPWGGTYHAVWSTDLSVEVGPLVLEESVREALNSGLMTLFFFVMGLEVKREVLAGELAEPRRAALPALAAVGGMLVPIALYLALNAGGRGASGWGVPMATDIAFALGVLALLGDRIPRELRAILLTVAVADDVGTILVIAVFYAGDLNAVALGIGVLLFGAVFGLRWLGVRSAAPYALVGSGMWLALHQSGVHATIAGVALGLATPLVAPYGIETVRERIDPLLERFEEARHGGRAEEAEVVLGRLQEVLRDTEPPLDRMERKLLPWSSFFVLPLFALANAGVVVTGSALAEAASSPVALGIVVGLVGGKVLGIAGFSWAGVRLGVARLPEGVTFRHLAGLGLVAGVGFTVSIFIAGLAFPQELVRTAKLAILVASVLAGAGGYVYLRLIGGGERAVDSSSPRGGRERAEA